MFGLGGGSSGDKKNANEFFFETEKEMKDGAKARKIKENLATKIQKLKEMQRSGETNKETFEMINALLLGYESIVKVLSRVKM